MSYFLSISFEVKTEFFTAEVRHSKARFPAIGNATQRNVPQRNATQVPLQRSASVRKQIETSSIFSVRRKDD